MTTKKPSPQDATLRNIRALKSRVEKLEAWEKTIWEMIYNLSLKVHTLTEAAEKQRTKRK